jgi:DNA-binding NarL/FixJ family response regulator
MTDPALPPPTVIAIISKHHIMVLGLQRLLESREAHHVIVHAYHRMTPEVLLPENRTDIFILDMETEPDSIDTIKRMREAAPQAKILLLSGSEDKERTRNAVDYGVDGVILKIQPATVVLAAIDAMRSPVRYQASVEQLEQNGAKAVALRKILSVNAGKESKNAVWPDALTEREREVIVLVRQGLSNKDIAYQLSIADSTVRHHLTSIFDKVGVPNRQKLLVHAHNIRSTPR